MPGSSSQVSIEKKHEISGFTLEKTVKLMKIKFSRILLMHQEVDVTVDQWVVMHILCKHQQLSQQELGELTFKDAPTITRIIDLLVQKGLVIRSTDEKDRRRFMIKLTIEGIEKYRFIEPIVQEFRAEAYAGISVDELLMLQNTLNKIFVNLSKQN